MPKYEVQIIRTYTWFEIEANHEAHAEAKAFELLDDEFSWDDYADYAIVAQHDDDDDSEPEPEQPKLHLVGGDAV